MSGCEWHTNDSLPNGQSKSDERSWEFLWCGGRLCQLRRTPSQQSARTKRPRAGCQASNVHALIAEQYSVLVSTLQDNYGWYARPTTQLWKIKNTGFDDNHYLLDCRRHPQCSCSSHTRKRKGENPIEIDRTTYSNIQSSSRCVPHFLLTSIVNSSALNYQEMQCLRSIFPSVRRMRFEKSTA